MEWDMVFWKGAEVKGVEERLKGFGVQKTWVCIPA